MLLMHGPPADERACDTALSAIKELQGRGITFAVARVRDEVRERLRLSGTAARPARTPAENRGFST